MRLALCVVGALACGSEPAPRTHHVEIRAMRYVPGELTVAVGDTIVWTNTDVVPHTVTAGAFDSQQLASQQQWQYRVTKAGTYPYVCTFHPTMQATVTAR